MTMHYYFGDRCVVASHLMHIHAVKLANLEHNAAYEPLGYAIFIDFMLNPDRNAVSTLVTDVSDIKNSDGNKRRW